LEQLPTPIPVIEVTTPPCSQVSAVTTHTSGVRSFGNSGIRAWPVSKNPMLCFIVILVVIAITTSATREFRRPLPDDRVVTKREPHLEGFHPRAIHIDRTSSVADYIVAWWMTTGENITVLRDGRAMDKGGLYFEAIRHDGTSSAAYTNLANCLAAVENVALSDGRAMNMRQLYFEAMRHDATESAHAIVRRSERNLATCLTAVNPSLFRMVVQ
jgi:hypothetical protein